MSVRPSQPFNHWWSNLATEPVKTICLGESLKIQQNQVVFKHLCQVADGTVMVVAWNPVVPALKSGNGLIGEKLWLPGPLDVQSCKVHARVGNVLVLKEMVCHFLRYELI